MSSGDGSCLPSPSLREGGGTQAKADKQKRQENASTGVSAATMRALSARMFAFYFRAPVKAFFRARVEYAVVISTLLVLLTALLMYCSYMGYARAINPNVRSGEPWSWRVSSPAILAHAVRQYGWNFIPNHVLPPLLANTAVGAVLYTSYLNTLALLHEPSARATKRTYPPPSVKTTFTAGFIAGTIQSVIAAPLDALQVRFQSAEMMEGKYKNMWHYALQKTKDIGPRGIFAGWTLSFVRDSLSFGAFFAIFEYVKGQCFYSFVSNVYGFYDRLTLKKRQDLDVEIDRTGRPEIKPHYLLEPAFLLMAGAAASITQSVIQHPITKIQELHYQRLEWIDSHRSTPGSSRVNALRVYADAYRKTFKQCALMARKEGGLRKYLYADFLMGTLRQVPSTSAGLIVFEILRRKYSLDEEVVKIRKDGYDILLV